MSDKADQKHNTQYTTEESARFMFNPTHAVKCMLKFLRKHYSEASVHSLSLPCQEMQCEVRVVTETHWKRELKGLLSTGAWMYFGGYLLETYSSTQQILALSTTESEHLDKRCCSCSGDPQCFGEVRHDAKDEG